MTTALLPGRVSPFKYSVCLASGELIAALQASAHGSVLKINCPQLMRHTQELGNRTDVCLTDICNAVLDMW